MLAHGLSGIRNDAGAAAP